MLIRKEHKLRIYFNAFRWICNDDSVSFETFEHLNHYDEYIEFAKKYLLQLPYDINCDRDIRCCLVYWMIVEELYENFSLTRKFDSYKSKDNSPRFSESLCIEYERMRNRINQYMRYNRMDLDDIQYYMNSILVIITNE